MALTVIVTNASPKPIYAQIADQVRAAILSGEAPPGTELPSVRKLAQDIRVSAITTKRAYDDLEREGFIVATQGRGTFVAEPNIELVREARLREIEAHVAKAIEAARSGGIDKATIEEILQLSWKED